MARNDMMYPPSPVVPNVAPAPIEKGESYSRESGGPANFLILIPGFGDL